MKDLINAIFLTIAFIVLSGTVYASPHTDNGNNGNGGKDHDHNDHKGDKGNRGKSGLDGVDGATGDQGPAGLDGINGLDADMTIVNANTESIADLGSRLADVQLNLGDFSNRISLNDSSAQSAQDSANLNSGRIDTLASRLTKMQNSIGKLRDDMNAGLAAAMATAGILKAPAGMSGFSVGVGFYDSEQAIAVGFSTTSSNDKHSFKFSTSHSGGEFSGAVSYGYFY